MDRDFQPSELIFAPQELGRGNSDEDAAQDNPAGQKGRRALPSGQEFWRVSPRAGLLCEIGILQTDDEIHTAIVVTEAIMDPKKVTLRIDHVYQKTWRASLGTGKFPD